MPHNGPSSIPSDTPMSTVSNLLSEPPIAAGSHSPSVHSSAVPIALQSTGPTSVQSSFPSPLLSESPSMIPSHAPSAHHSEIPNKKSSSVPSPFVSQPPTTFPSDVPSVHYSEIPNGMPSSAPSHNFTKSPAVLPSDVPSAHYSEFPSMVPSTSPSSVPTSYPKGVPSYIPTAGSSISPTAAPSISRTPTKMFIVNLPNWSTDEPTNDPTDPPITVHSTDIPTAALACGLTPQRRSELILNILDSVSDSAILRNQNTPQGMAADWIIGADTQRVCPDDEKLVQRYVLALIYFSVGGDKWFQCSASLDTADDCGVEFPFEGRDRFLDSSNECSWAGVRCDAELYVTEIEFGACLPLAPLCRSGNIWALLS